MSRSTEFHALFLKLRIADQQRYYDDTRAEYGRAHEQAIVVRNVLLVGAALAGFAGQLVGEAGRAWLAVAAAVLAALAAALTGFEALIGFGKLERLYSDAARNLALAAVDWTAADPNDDLEPEIDRVEGIFRAENAQWGQLAVESAPSPDGSASTAP